MVNPSLTTSIRSSKLRKQDKDRAQKISLITRKRTNAKNVLRQLSISTCCEEYAQNVHRTQPMPQKIVNVNLHLETQSLLKQLCRKVSQTFSPDLSHTLTIYTSMI